jgi:hypothetical protein
MMECHKWHMNFADISVAGDFAHPRHLIIGLVLQRIDSGGPFCLPFLYREAGEHFMVDVF